MTFKARYESGKAKLLLDNSICKENRDLFKKFFEFEEIKLRRMNGITSIDESSFKTLYGYLHKFRNVNRWFKNKPLSKLTKKEFEKVFTDLADGKILNSKGQPLEDVDSYIYKIFKSKLFKLAKISDIVEESLEFYKSHNTTQANFIQAKDMMMIIEHIPKTKLKLLFCLAFDIGENVSALIRLKKQNCRKQFNEATKEYEYLIHLKKDTLKRARLERTEPTRLSKSVELLDFVLKDLKDGEYIFTRERVLEDESKNEPFSLRNAEKFFQRAVQRLNIKTTPQNKKPLLKDIRSSMACDCLRLGWSIEEVNSRLGHSVNSKALKPYVTFLALDKGKPKIREYKENIQTLNEKLEEQKNVNALVDKRQKELLEELEKMKDNNEHLTKALWHFFEKHKDELKSLKIYPPK